MAGDAVLLHELKPHALVVPARGHGHFTASLLLSKALAEVGFDISFVCFSSEYANIKAKRRYAGSFSSLFQMLEMASSPNSSDQNSSPCGGSGSGVPATRVHVLDDGFVSQDIDKFFLATPSMVENLETLILKLEAWGNPPTCLISDSMAPWTVPIAQRLGIARVDYYTASAMSYLLLIHYPPLFSQGIFPEKGCPTQWKSRSPLMLDHIPGLAPVPSELYNELRFVDSSSNFVSIFKEISSYVKFGERILIQTMSELEPDAFHAFEAVGTPAYAIGPLHSYMEVQQDKQENALSTQHGELADCLAWLDTQAESSVIYIAFGSIASLSVAEIQELAYGLEASKNPFLWVVTDASRGNGDLSQVLPDGFLGRTSRKGMIVSWAPQVKVLGHKAVGGFLSHCGWNSTIDSLWAGVPMLCCPRMAEQRSNARYVCDVWQLGLELERTDKGEVERRFVEVGVSKLMQGEVGRKARGEAQVVKQIVRKTCQPGGQSFTNLQKFYDDMKGLYSPRMC